MRVSTLQPEFVTSAPDQLEDGVLYISIPFKTSMHLCACGCGNKVVMPIRPGAWTMTYDGESISMNPSVGNWTFPCRSHYWIDHNDISWVPDWGGHGSRSHGRRPSVQPPAPQDDRLDTNPESRLRRLWRKVARLLHRSP